MRRCFFFSSRRRHTRYWRDWSSDVCSSDLSGIKVEVADNPEASGCNKSQKVLHINLMENSNWKGVERKEVGASVGTSQFKYLRFKVRKNKIGYITFKFETEDGTTAYLGYNVKEKDQWIEADVSPYQD